QGFFLYAPQSAAGYWSADEQKRIVNMLGQAKSEFSIDTDKIYVTGLSAGGGGTRKMIETYTSVFAAAVPLAATPSGTDQSMLAGKPVWAFHAVNDGTVNVGITRTWINNIRVADDKSA